jgi:hypothetical protein
VAATRCIVVDCPSVSDSQIQPEAGWALLKLSALQRGALVAMEAGSMCPACVAELPAMRSNAEQVVRPPAPKDLEPAAAADAETPTPAPDPLAAAAAVPGDFGAVPTEPKDE